MTRDTRLSWRRNIQSDGRLGVALACAGRRRYAQKMLDFLHRLIEPFQVEGEGRLSMMAAAQCCNIRDELRERGE